MPAPPTGSLQRLRKRAELVARLSETWLHRLDSPNRVVFDVTRRCNLRCSMCRTWEDPRRDELSVPEIADIMRQLPRLTWLDVTGGEPFLRKDAKQLLLTIADTTPALTVLHFPTNGWFHARIVDTCRAIVARRPELQLIVTVSIDGPPEVHDRIRGRAGAFDRALETFAVLRAMPGVDVFLGTTLTPESEPSLAALEALLRARFPDFHAREWHWNRLQISQHFFANADLAGAEPRRPGLAREHLARRGAPRSFVDAMELAFLINLEFYQRGEASGIGCESLRSTAFISPEGELYPCHVWDRPLGNLRERSFAELWHDRRTLAARAEVERLACGGCFTPCEAYPALAGNPGQTIRQTAKRSLRLVLAP
ncbi:radical SAM protein [Pseudenhygromyxa sp. WMMC2535]|uniref:radical SAM protein n=1 Tax=Pseudenhygromyxa sp. WMMC2535 TaxID=2712867 RepID=UPI001554C788|nr:radical SAM protein [Pseudenhygromyxa sp. WMMC2535]